MTSMPRLNALKYQCDYTAPHNKALVRMQTTLRFVCTAQLGRYANKKTVKRCQASKMTSLFRSGVTSPMLPSPLFLFLPFNTVRTGTDLFNRCG